MQAVNSVEVVHAYEWESVSKTNIRREEGCAARSWLENKESALELIQGWAGLGPEEEWYSGWSHWDGLG